MSYKKGLRLYKNMGLETSKELDFIFKEAKIEEMERKEMNYEKSKCAMCDYNIFERTRGRNIAPHLCEDCEIKSKWKTYTVTIPITGYYHWTGIAESEEKALEEGKYELTPDYEPCFRETEVGAPTITNIETKNYIASLMKILKEELKK